MFRSKGRNASVAWTENMFFWGGEYSDYVDFTLPYAAEHLSDKFNPI